MTEDEKIRALLTDELTGLGNRRAWEEGDRMSVQAMVDVEGLKWVNDNVGWALGDALLLTVTLHRAGRGDEFRQDAHALGEPCPQGSTAADAASKSSASVPKRIERPAD